MLKYKYTTNDTDLTLPYHIHGISSDTSSVGISINGNSIGNHKPNMFEAPDKYYFTRYFLPQEKLLQLLIVGSRQTYDAKENKSIFNQDSAVFIKLENGNCLYQDPITGKYSWDPIKRSKFYFNPHYFDSEYLWNLRLGYVPTGIKLTYQWPKNYEQLLFIPSTVTLGNSVGWAGAKDVPDIDPLVIDPFIVYDSGETVDINLNAIIDLKELKSGDLLEFTNGNETISLVVNIDEETLFNYQDPVIITRPILHADIETINPNGIVHYAKGMRQNTQELINLTLYGKQIQFTGRRL